jgi:branched-chain amino acid transport system permease protein
VLLVLMMLFRREGLLPESRTRALLKTPSRTEAESLGADSLEAEAETAAFEGSDAAEDAKIAASATAMAGSAAPTADAAPRHARSDDE